MYHMVSVCRGQKLKLERVLSSWHVSDDFVEPAGNFLHEVVDVRRNL